MSAMEIVMQPKIIEKHISINNEENNETENNGIEWRNININR
jgi:hypothetical protein